MEALLGAISGGKEKQREKLIRYQIFLTLLLEGHEGAAQKAMDEFKMMDDSPALYYAQAAWAFQHGNPKQGNNWVANASNLYSAELNRAFAAPFSDLGWVSNATAPNRSAMPAPAGAERPGKPEATPNAAATPTKPAGKPVAAALRGASQADNSRSVAGTDTRSFSDTGKGRERGEKAEAIVNRFNKEGEQALS